MGFWLLCFKLIFLRGWGYFEYLLYSSQLNPLTPKGRITRKYHPTSVKLFYIYIVKNAF
ncbi:hypothetical protein HMPREF1396_00811 [Helicobacter pylori GAM114Ai]|nr:hypothetical protein HMPREF1396_00811 [Helicobacter pylori GAM114Ai]